MPVGGGPKRKRAAPPPMSDSPPPESFPVGSAEPAIDTSDISDTDPAFYEKAQLKDPLGLLEKLRYGICRGGFYDGKNLAHHSDLFWVAWRHGAEEKGPITYAGPETEEVYYTRYQWDPAKREWNDVR